jgi:putative ABC transport system permease protein
MRFGTIIEGREMIKSPAPINADLFRRARAHLLKLAIRNVARQRARTALTLAAIAFGVAGLILAGGFVEDVYVQLGEATIHSQLGHLQIYTKGYYAQGSRKPQEYMLARPDEIVRQVSANPAVQDTMLRLNFSALLNNGRADLAVIGEGIEPEKEARLGSFVRLLQGRTLSAQDRFGILVGEGVAKALKLAPGSPVTLVTNAADGVLNSLDFEVVGVFRSFSKDYDNRAVRIPLAAARNLLATDAANTAVVSLHETPRTAEVKAELERLLADRNVEIMAWDELSDFYKKTIALYKRQFGVLQVITLVMVVLSVANTVSMTAFERVGEFGTMRAMGDRSSGIFRLVVLESVIVGSVGAAAGIVIGIALAAAISTVGISMPPPPNAESGYTAYIRIVPTILVAAFAVGFLAAVLAAIMPARWIARIPLDEALRQNV